jgi:two-component system, NtrC family, sensor histidine kinase KinB
MALPEITELRVLAEALNRMQAKLWAYRASSLGELLAAKDLARTTIAALSDPVMVFGAHGQLLLANDASNSVFGVTMDNADDLQLVGTLVPDPIAAARDYVLARGEQVSPQSLAEAVRWVTPEGERYFLVRASQLRTDATGHAAIVIAQEVTRFRRIDALKSDVVATVSHELKTPLTSLRLATHMLLDAAIGALNAVQFELAQTARDETERLQNTVDELLDLVRIERDAGAITSTRLRVDTFLHEVAHAQRKVAEMNHVHVECEVEPRDCEIELDPEQIAIVLGNLLSNAIRHSAQGQRAFLTAQMADAAVVFSVRDEGEGIAPASLPHIFERHWSGTAPATLKGRHGLGLAIARKYGCAPRRHTRRRERPWQRKHVSPVHSAAATQFIKIAKLPTHRRFRPPKRQAHSQFYKAWSSVASTPNSAFGSTRVAECHFCARLRRRRRVGLSRCEAASCALSPSR